MSKKSRKQARRALALRNVQICYLKRYLHLSKVAKAEYEAYQARLICAEAEVRALRAKCSK